MEPRQEPAQPAQLSCYLTVPAGVGVRSGGQPVYFSLTVVLCSQMKWALVTSDYVLRSATRGESAMCCYFIDTHTSAVNFSSFLANTPMCWELSKYRFSEKLGQQFSHVGGHLKCLVCWNRIAGPTLRVSDTVGLGEAWYLHFYQVHR